MPATTYLEGLVFGHLLLQNPFSIEDWYVGLWATNPTASGSLSGEVTASDYSRRAVNWNPAWQNSTAINWGAATSNWGAVLYVVLVNSPNKGNGKVLAYDDVGPYSVDIGRPLTIPALGLQLTL
jgi:hypothetical protein